eukprot:CAMPEP_0183727326 /NCGR_PEP_ID=MMETSP0737-20130205/25418_1 /TAXON_ID=385413 /ORGANISM="Thalassiosira miniscula, Strain CCMP1093" /LENGTH=427 /DNA_ID=CAMNT_0025958927 /DNA_START=294 /DNA_END=1577 /DNA_ORIENTATION=+
MPAFSAIAIAQLALLAITGASASTDSQSQRYLPVTHARSVGMNAIKRFHSRALAGRRMESGDEMEDGMGLNVTMNTYEQMICTIFNTDMGQEDFKEDMQTEGMVCSDISCDDSAGTPNLTMNCVMEGEYCEEDAGDDEEFCVKDTMIDFSMDIVFVGSSNIEATQCGTYTKPDYMAAMGNGCVYIQGTMDMGAMMEDAALVEAGMMTEEEAEDAANEEIDIASCSAEFGNEATKVTCECGSCDDGAGFELSCDNGLVSEGCTDFDADIVDVDPGAGETPEVSVLRLIAIPDAGNTATETDAPDGGSGAETNADKTDASPGAGDTTTQTDAQDGDSSAEMNADKTDASPNAGDTATQTDARDGDSGAETKTDETIASPGEDNTATQADALDGDIGLETNADDTSHAASRAGGIVSGLSLASVSFLALM